MSILKCINGSNNEWEEIPKLGEYITEEHKTDGGKWVGAYGCSPINFVRDFKSVTKAHHKMTGKQYEQFTLSLTPDNPNIPDETYMKIGSRIAAHFDRFQSVYVLHKDTDIRHLHFMLNSVSYKDGKKFSQTPSDLNDLKTYCNHILHENGFDIIKVKTEDLSSKEEHDFSEGFDFLEIYDDVPEKLVSPIVDASNDSEFAETSEREVSNNMSHNTPINSIFDYNNAVAMSYPPQPFLFPGYQQPLPPAYPAMGGQVYQPPTYQAPIYPTPPIQQHNLNYSSNFTVNVQSMQQYGQVMDSIRDIGISTDMEQIKVANAEIDSRIIANCGNNGNVCIDRSNNFTINLPQDNDTSDVQVIDTDFNNLIGDDNWK